ncbi:MAG TPA: histidine kinase [Bacteroidia bacterium]|nr:histidine kinase [Bacteroidia bacterium]
MKRKRLSVSLFVVQALAWTLWIALPYLNPDPGIREYHLPYHIKHFSEHLMYLVFYYVNYYFLVPKFLPEKGTTKYALTVTGIMLFIFTVNNFVEYAVFGNYRIQKPVSFVSLVPMMSVYILSTTLSLFENWFRDKNEKKKLTQEKENAEIGLLRMQMSPHFLFNSLNNISSLVRFDQENAEKYIQQLSGLMRYTLNVSGEKKVPLQSEIGFLENYISLQKLRLPENFDLRTRFPSHVNGASVEPLILVSFVENAFKHGNNGNAADFIEMNLDVNGNRLVMETKNLVSAGTDKDLSTGIGLKNVRKRLAIVYPGRHVLIAEEKDNVFNVHLEIELNEDQLHHR